MEGSQALAWPHPGAAPLNFQPRSLVPPIHRANPTRLGPHPAGALNKHLRYMGWTSGHPQSCRAAVLCGLLTSVLSWPSATVCLFPGYAALHLGLGHSSLFPSLPSSPAQPFPPAGALLCTQWKDQSWGLLSTARTPTPPVASPSLQAGPHNVGMEPPRAFDLA